MSASGILKFFGLSRFVETSPDAKILAAVKQHRLAKFVEIGVHDGSRAEELVRAAVDAGASAPRYAGIDAFEAADGGHSLKEVHRRLSALPGEVRLVPGTAALALPRCANLLRGTDLVIVRHSQSLDGAWHFLPRMLHQTSQVWLASEEPGNFEVLRPQDVSARMPGRRAAAA